MLTVKEVESILENHNEDDEEAAGEIGWHFWDEMAYYTGREELVPELGTVEVVDSETGGEGHGEDCHMTFKITADDSTVRYFEKTGYYLSYDGTTWDGDLTEVVPREKLITVYDRIK